MKLNCLITTYFCDGGTIPSSQELKRRFNADVSEDDIFVNFTDKVSPYKLDHIPNVGPSRRRDLVFCKIFLLNSFIKNNIAGKYEYVCHIDYSDAKFCRSYNEMMNSIMEKNIDIVISTEKKSWPYIDAICNWTNPKANLQEEDFKYLNSGALVSKTATLTKILDELEKLCLSTNIDFWDDQGVWQYYDLFVSNITKDHNSEYFFSTGFLDDTYYKIIENKIITKFDTMPYIIHDNSSFSLNLTSKI